MITEIKDFILVAPYAEITPPPAPGTAPDAPGGLGEGEVKEGEGVDWSDPDSVENAPHDRPHIGQFEFPEDNDSVI
ncbi:hypothetical protein KAZ92_03370 [Candidatus Gracilibacteria bacterium]|nr:hypothetical protein [Candidatus Gracilibacteria bacterium]